MKALLGKRWLHWSAAASVVLVAGVALWLVLRPAGEPERERQYRAESACLITGEQGIRGVAAAPVWSGMQRASLETRIQVNFLAVPGQQSPQAATTYLAGMLQGRCDLVVAVDQGPVAAVSEAAKAYPKQQFAVVNGTASANVTVLDGSPENAYALLVSAF